LAGSFFRGIASTISAKWPESTKNHQQKEGTMDWVKVLFTIVEKAATIVIQAMNAGDNRK
jgi:hypothetical protein